MYVCMYVFMYVCMEYMYDILVLVAVLNHPLRQGKPEIVPASSEASQFDIFFFRGSCKWCQGLVVPSQGSGTIYLAEGRPMTFSNAVVSCCPQGDFKVGTWCTPLCWDTLFLVIGLHW